MVGIGDETLARRAYQGHECGREDWPRPLDIEIVGRVGYGKGVGQGVEL